MCAQNRIEAQCTFQQARFEALYEFVKNIDADQAQKLLHLNLAEPANI